MNTFSTCETGWVATATCLVALTGCGKTDNPASPPPVIVQPAPAVVAETQVTELHEVERYMQVDETSPDKPVIAVMLSNRPATDAALEHLNGLADLKVLGLNNTKVTDAGLVHLKNLTNLEQLYLQNSQIGDSGLENLKGLAKLWSLNLENTLVTDAGLDHLKGLTELRYLHLHGSEITDRGVSEIRRSLPKCTVYTMKRTGVLEQPTDVARP